MSKLSIEWTRTIYDDEAGTEEEKTSRIPCKWAICSECDGHGGHSRHIGAITQEDRDRDWSEDEFDHYMRGGYDRQCEECKGSGKVKVPNMDALSPELREEYQEHLEDEADYARECAAERRYLYGF